MPPYEMNEQELSLKLMVVLSKAYKSIMDQAAKDIKRYGLSASEFGIMDVLYNKGKLPLQQISDKILITSGTMTYNMDKLVKKDWVKRVPCTEDRRVIYAELTESGREQFALIFPGHVEHIQQMMSGLTSEQKQTIIELLKAAGKGAYSHDNKLSRN